MRGAFVALLGASLFVSERSANAEESPRVLTLGQALSRSLERSPDLASFSREIRAREARALQEGLLPNPVLSVDVENLGGSGDFSSTDSAETTLMIGQLIELGGKGAKRRAVGARSTEVAEWEYEVARLAVIARTTTLVVTGLGRQQALQLEAAQIRATREALGRVKEEVAAGELSDLEVTRVEVAVTLQQIDHDVAKRTLRAAFVRLATQWGDTEPDFDALAGDLDHVAPIPSEAELVRQLESTPGLLRWRSEVAVRAAQVELQRAGALPDVLVRLGPRHFNDDDDWAVVLGVEVPIPVFDRNQGGRRESRELLEKARRDQRSAQLQVRRALTLTYLDLASAHDEIVTLREVGIPAAEKAYHAMRETKDESLEFADRVAIERTLFDLRTRLIDRLVAYHIARAGMEALIGGPLPAPLE